jgi:hypothetical protein
VIPISRRKLSANNFTVGWRSTQLAIALAKAIITITAPMAAEIMMPIPSTMPMAVITESSENTTSRSRI